MAHRHIAGAAFGPRRRIALGDLRTRPAAAGAEAVDMDSNEARGQNVVAAVAVPVVDADAVHHALVLVADEAALPLAGDIVHQRDLVAVIRRLSLRPG